MPRKGSESSITLRSSIYSNFQPLSVALTATSMSSTVVWSFHPPDSFSAEILQTPAVPTTVRKSLVKKHKWIDQRSLAQLEKTLTIVTVRMTVETILILHVVVSGLEDYRFRPNLIVLKKNRSEQKGNTKVYHWNQRRQMLKIQLVALLWNGSLETSPAVLSSCIDPHSLWWCHEICYSKIKISKWGKVCKECYQTPTGLEQVLTWDCELRKEQYGGGSQVQAGSQHQR